MCQRNKVPILEKLYAVHSPYTHLHGEYSDGTTWVYIIENQEKKTIDGICVLLIGSSKPLVDSLFDGLSLVKAICCLHETQVCKKVNLKDLKSKAENDISDYITNKLQLLEKESGLRVSSIDLEPLRSIKKSSYLAKLVLEVL